MNCLDPLKIVQIREGGFRPELMTVPCGKCMACLADRAGQWTFRIMQEWKHCETAHFITLTYSDDNLVTVDGKPTVWKKDFQNFMKRLRNNLLRMFHRTVQLRYYAVSEYGPSHERPGTLHTFREIRQFINISSTISHSGLIKWGNSHKTAIPGEINMTDYI